MGQIVLKADVNQCEILNWQANTNEVNARVLNVEMDDELCSCAKQFVTFELGDGKLYESLVVDGKAKIPIFEKSEFIKIGLYSADLEGDECKKRYSPHPVSKYVNVGSYKGKADATPTPTPGDYEELLELIKGMGTGSNINLIHDIDLEAEYGENDAPSMNGLLSVLMLIGEAFVDVNYVNKVIDSVKALENSLSTHITNQNSINSGLIERLNTNTERLNALEDDYEVVNELSLLVGGAE